MFLGMLEACWETQPIFLKEEREGLLSPKSLIFPLLGFNMPRIVRRSVVLPPPFGPTSPTNSPQLIVREILSKTTFFERFTDRFSTN